jgi:preprotein translocase subunit SecY
LALVIVACVLLTMAIEKDTSTVRSSYHSGDFEQDGGNRQWIPLKLNASGVMPIILLRLYVYTCGCGWFI